MTYTDDVCYRMWLKGRSLRELGAIFGVDFTTIRRRLMKAFGSQATNPRANSLTRSLLTDYPDDANLLQWAIENHASYEDSDRHRSQHSMDMLSQFTVVHDPALMDLIAVSYDPGIENPTATEDLRLPLLLSVLTVTVRLLSVAIYQHWLSLLPVDSTEDKRKEVLADG